MVGPDLIRQRAKDTKATELCTASDEAFAILLLENSYARWENKYDANGGIPSQRRGDTKRTFDSDIEAKYTRGASSCLMAKSRKRERVGQPKALHVLTRCLQAFEKIERSVRTLTHGLLNAFENNKLNNPKLRNAEWML